MGEHLARVGSQQGKQPVLDRRQVDDFTSALDEAGGKIDLDFADPNTGSPESLRARRLARARTRASSSPIPNGLVR